AELFRLRTILALHCILLFRESGNKCGTSSRRAQAAPTAERRRSLRRWLKQQQASRPRFVGTCAVVGRRHLPRDWRSAATHSAALGAMSTAVTEQRCVVGGRGE